MRLQSQIDPWGDAITPFFIAGFEKCGSTSLHFALEQHPDIFMSKVKEPKYFEAEYHLGMNYYREQYWDELQFPIRAAGESRIHNSVIEYVPDRIKESLPNSKIIFLLRDPIERAYSGWRHWQRMRPGREPLDFEGAILSNLDSFYETGAVPFLSERDWMLQRDPMGGSYKRLYIEHGLYSAMMYKFFSKFDCIALPFEAKNSPEFIPTILDFIEVDNGVKLQLPHLNQGPDNKTHEQIKEEFPTAYKVLSEIYLGDLQMLHVAVPMNKYLNFFNINYLEKLS